MRKANRSIDTSRSSDARGRHELDTARLRERLIALIRDLVLIPGSEERPDDLRRAVEWVRNHLESLESVEVRSYESNSVHSLVALPEHCTTPDVLMFGHVDVVHHANREYYRSELRDGKICGPGTGARKGIVTLMLELFR
jgi:succinyl-diaminopimelate desuccinylase